MQKPHDKDIVIIKIGGSCATKKDLFETAQNDIISNFWKVLSKHLLDSQPHNSNTLKLPSHTPRTKFKYVIVHGAGSFGHFQASKYQISQCFSQEGFSKTRASVQKLNRILLNEAVEIHHLPVVSVSPCDSWTLLPEKKIVARHNIPHLTQLVDNNLVPLIHGDVVFLENQFTSSAILSGDLIIQTLVQHWQSRVFRVIFLTDVEGVYDRPPNEPNAKLLPLLKIPNSSKSVTVETSTRSHDVTGGIGQKIKSSFEIAKSGIDVFVISGDFSTTTKSDTFQTRVSVLAGDEISVDDWLKCSAGTWIQSIIV